MQHRADQLPGRAGIQPRVAVERQQKAGPCQCVPVSGDAQLRLPVAQEPRQLEQGPALALPAAPALAVKAAGTYEEVKAAAVLPVQPVDLLHRGGEDGGIRLRLGAVRLRQIGQQPEAQVFSLSPAGKAQLLQPPRRVMGLPLAAEQRRDDAERAPLGRDAFRKIQSGQAPRRQQTQEQRVQHALDELRDRQQQQQRRRAAVERQTDAETQQQRQQQVHRDIQTGEEGTGRAEQIRADVPFLRLGGTDETAGADMLLDPLAARELLQPTQIIEPALAIHPREDAVGVGGQHRGAHIRAVQELLRVELREEPQRAEERLQLCGEGVQLGAVGHAAADGGDLLQAGCLEAAGEERELRPAQHGDALKAVQKEPAPLLVSAAEPGSEQTAAEGQHQQTLVAAAQAARRAQRLGREQMLPLYQIPVVQQPFTGRRDLRAVPIPPAHGRGTAADFPHPGGERPRGGLSAAFSRGVQQPCRGRCVVVQAVVFNIQGEVPIHDDLLHR